MTLYVIRHGETDINRMGGHFQGQIEIPLNETGVRQAEEARDSFRQRNLTFTHVFASPLSRAFKTAEIVSGFSPDQIITDDRLLELNFGPFEGRRWEEMNPRTLHALLHDPLNYYPPAGMETIYHLVARCSQFLQDMASRSDELSGNILIGTHGGTIRGMLCAMHAMDMRYFWEGPMRNCACYVLAPEGNGFRLVSGDVPEPGKALTDRV